LLKTISIEKNMIKITPLKSAKYVTRKRDGEKCENNVNQKPSRR
jgi:hypothetical protein